MIDELFQKACAGDRDAINRLFSEQIVAFAKRCASYRWSGLSSGEREDIAQEALSRAYEKLIKSNVNPKPDANFASFLCSFISNVGREEFKRGKVEITDKQGNKVKINKFVSIDLEDEDGNTLLNGIPDPKLPPDRQAAYKELYEKADSEVMPSIRKIVATTNNKACIFERWWEAIIDGEWDLESEEFKPPTGWVNSVAKCCKCSAPTVSATVNEIQAKFAEAIHKLGWKDD